MCISSRPLHARFLDAFVSLQSFSYLADVAKQIKGVTDRKTDSYAWFTMNKEVEVTGMQVRTVVGSNLLISPDNDGEASYKNNLNQTRACTLEPSSTIDGITYFWTSTSNVDAAGNAIAESYTQYAEALPSGVTTWNHVAAKTAYDKAFNDTYAFTSPAMTYAGVAYGYVDYTFYLKAVNTEQEARNLNLTKLNMLYNAAAPTDQTGTDYGVVDKAWRAALIVQDITSGFAYTATYANGLSAPMVSGFTSTDNTITAPFEFVSNIVKISGMPKV